MPHSCLPACRLPLLAGVLPCWRSSLLAFFLAGVHRNGVGQLHAKHPSQESQLTDGVRRRPYSLVLFDEAPGW